MKKHLLQLVCTIFTIIISPGISIVPGRFFTIFAQVLTFETTLKSLELILSSKISTKFQILTNPFYPKADLNSAGPCSKNFDFIDQTDYCQLNYNNCTSGSISNMIGLITLVAGITGTLVGMILYKNFDQKTKSAGPIVGGTGLVLGSSLIYAVYVCKFEALTWLWVLFASGLGLICLNYGVLLDMVNRVVIPEQRSLAHGSKNILARLIGSILPPYLAGLGIEKSQTDLFQDMVTGNSNKLFHAWDFQKLRYVAITDALMKSSMFGFIAGIFWYLAARFWATDEEKKDDQVRNS